MAAATFDGAAAVYGGRAVLDDWDSLEEESPPSRPWATAALLCGSLALGVEVLGGALLVFGFVLSFPLSLFSIFGGGSPLTDWGDMLTRVTLGGAGVLGAVGVSSGAVSLLRGESIAMPLIATVLSAVALVLPAFAAFPWLGQAFGF